jgi:2-oxoglutarate/2-oxoacid ferredoxin oxidoreductase subunit alpha
MLFYMDYTIKIGGEAGQGTQTIGDILTKVIARSGYHLFSHQDYESRVRGGHNFYQIRVSDKPVTASRKKIDIIVALDKETINRHLSELSETGRLIYDSESLKERRDGEKLTDIPFARLATDNGGNQIMENIVATGAILGMTGMNIDILTRTIEETFQSKGEEIVSLNIKMAKAGYEFAVSSCPSCKYSAAPAANPNMLVNGVEALALGAIASGVKLYAAYPMTPTTGIMNYIAGKAADFGIIVEQAEDEICAINMTIGGSFGGVRSMTGTSGGGFALMAEGISLAAMTETPVVIALGQRPGPATGFPTRTEQGDLQFAISAGHGEFPRLVFAPGSPEQAFYLINKAFNLAEKYQIPAIVMFDQYLGDSQWTYPGFDTKRLVFIDYRLRGDEFAGMAYYKRHAYTADGVSPLAVPGDAWHVVVTDSDEHNEEGHIVEDAETRVGMTNKRLFKKSPGLRKEISPPLLYGSEKPKIVITGWGSSYGLMKEAVDILSAKHNIAMLHFSEICPLPLTDNFNYMNILDNAAMSICFEQNATGQFARLLRSETGHTFSKMLHRFDGRPYLLEEFTGDINAIIE